MTIQPNILFVFFQFEFVLFSISSERACLETSYHVVCGIRSHSSRLQSHQKTSLENEDRILIEKGISGCQNMLTRSGLMTLAVVQM